VGKTEEMGEKMKILLVTKATGDNFSLEAGLADGQRHFDHHGDHVGNPAPCSDERIPVIGDNETVEITHIDADSFIGLLRMSGRKLPHSDFALMEQVDLNGSSVCPDKFNPTLLYMVGIGQIARELRFPRPSVDAPNDISELIETMMDKTADEIITIGREATEKSETAYRKCLVASAEKIGYWVVGSDDPLDPSRPYEDGVHVVVVHRTHYESISIYCSPTSEYAFGGKEIASIQFAGHPKAAGSPRGVAFNDKDGYEVYEELVEYIHNF